MQRPNVLRISLYMLLLGATPLMAQPPAPPSLDVSDFRIWESRSFSGETLYLPTFENGDPILNATAAGTASAFYRQGKINLQQTPCLHWRWRINATAPVQLDEQSKTGDDYAARVYVVRSGGLMFWRAKTINYVWSANQPLGTRWPNAYAGSNAQMWALDTGNQFADQWQWHSRDIQQDWQQAFGEPIRELDGIAIMTDGDDSGSQLSAAYATLRFTSRNPSGQCELVH
ncbi:MAG: DUF3047 domain-containing protein [Pseudohongiella sp.]|nr:DUF3047 domain-containing protein [Pseudohongiella sp.]